MAKIPIAGQCKSRLARDIGSEAAAAVSLAMTQTIVHRLRKVGRHRVLAITPDDSVDRFRSMVMPDRFRSMVMPDRTANVPANLDAARTDTTLPRNNRSWTCVPQGDGDLGQRMLRLARRLSDADVICKPRRSDEHSSAFVIGTDMPSLAPSDFHRMHGLLADADVVLGPSADGGYWCIGFRLPKPKTFQRLFCDMPWSTSEVTAETLRRSQAAGLRTVQADVRTDVDDLNSLCDVLGDSGRLSPLRSRGDSTDLASRNMLPMTPQTIRHVATTDPEVMGPLTHVAAGFECLPGRTVIIGGGAIGLSIAWELARQGDDITLIDRGRVGRGTSWAAAGILPPARYGNNQEPVERLRGFAESIWPTWCDRLRDDSGRDIGYRQCGAWYAATTLGEAASLAGMAAEWSERGIASEFRSPVAFAAAVQNNPSSSGPKIVDDKWLSSVRSCLWTPEESQVDPRRYVDALAIGCQNRGVKFIDQTNVVGLSTADSARWSPVTDHGPIGEAFERVVLCGGPLLGQIDERWRLRHSIVPVRGQILFFRNESPLGSGFAEGSKNDPSAGVFNVGHRYVVRRSDGSLLVGSCEQEAGFDDSIDPEVTGDLRGFASQLLPSLADRPPDDQWTGLRPMTFDGLPMLGPFPERTGVFVAGGFHRSGIHLSPSAAVIAARMIHSAPAPVPMDGLEVFKHLDPPLAVSAETV